MVQVLVLIGTLILLALVMLSIAALGASLSGLVKQEISTSLESFLYSSGIGFAVIAFITFLLGITKALSSISVVLLFFGIIGLSWKHSMNFLNTFWAFLSSLKWKSLSRLEMLMIFLLIVLVVLNGTISLAPLTGSDSMQYHFAIPKLYADAHAIHQISWSIASFYLGLPHMLILLGMVLGADEIALAFNFAGALLSILSVLYLSRRFLPRNYSILASLVYAVTPMVYWQATSGYIDLWTVFYFLLAVNATVYWLENNSRGWLVIAGLFSGFAASSKYTLWPGLFLLGFGVICTACIRKRKTQISWDHFLWFFLSAFVAGSWPLLRNMIWTGDPMYPIFTKVIAGGGFNPSYLAETSVGFSVSLVDVVLYPFRSILRGGEFGGGHFFGPVVLAFLPLLFIVARRGNISSRMILGFCIGFFLINAITTQIPKYLLPIFPLLIILVLEGMFRSRHMMLLRLGCVSVLVVYLIFGISSNIVYAKDFLPVVMGWETKNRFLKRKAADYTIAKLVNNVVPRGEKVLVTFLHPYYLDVDYIQLPHDQSLLLDSSKIKTGDQLRTHLQQLGVSYVVFTEGYPRMEPIWEGLRSCCLETIEEREVSSVQSRRLGTTQHWQVTIYRLEPEGSSRLGGEKVPHG